MMNEREEAKDCNGYEREPKRVSLEIKDKVKVSDSDSAEVIFESAEGVIVLLDTLGMKGIWNRKDPKVVLKTRSGIEGKLQLS